LGGSDECQVLLQSSLAVLRTQPLGRLKRKDAPDAAFPHNLGLSGKAAGDGIRPLGAVVKTGDAAAQHVGQVEVSRGTDHLVVEPVFHQRPPEIDKEGPEAGRRFVEGDAVGQHAVEMRMGVHKAGRKRLPPRIPDVISRIQSL
jgi:hypothetical protein